MMEQAASSKRQVAKAIHSCFNADMELYYANGQVDANALDQPVPRCGDSTRSTGFP